MTLSAMPISDLADVRSGGGAPQDPNDFSASGHPFVRAGSLSRLIEGEPEESLEKLEPRVAQNHGLRLFPAGTVLFAKSGMSATKGHVYRLRHSAYVVNHLAALIPHDARDGAFLVRALQRFPPCSLIKDSAYPSIRLGDIAAMAVLAPSNPSQRLRIADLLDRAEAMRVKRRAALATLEHVVQAIFVDQFGNPVTNPKGWTRGQLGNAILSASDGPHVSPAYTDVGVPFLSTRHVRAGQIAWDDVKFISREDAEVQWRKCKPERGDILYTKGGTTGLAATVATDDPFAIWVHVALLKVNPAKAEPMWLEAMLNSDFCYRQSQNLTHGIANRDLGLTRMVQINLFLPPLEQQREFIRRRRTVDALKSSYRASLAKLDELFASLQHRAFRGEL